MSARAVLLLCVAAAIGCADGRSVVTLTITADAAIGNIDRLHLVATDDARHVDASPIEIAVAGHTLPPDVTVPLAAPARIHGGLTLAVTALAADGTTVAAGSTDVTIAPSKSFAATVKLSPMLHRALSFVTQPASAKPDAALGGVQVAIVDDAGATLADATDVVSLTLAGGVPGAVLSGHVRVAAVAGVATFPDLSVNLAGSGYTIMASAPNADGVTSQPFDITPDIWIPANGGLDGGSMGGFFFDPNDANDVWGFSPSGGGLWRTRDGGSSWVQYGSTLPTNAIASGAVSSKTADTIFLAGSDKTLRRSDDGGASWDVVGAGLPPPNPGASVVVAPNDDTLVFATMGGVIYRSTDRGDNFAVLATPMGLAGSLTIDPAAPSTYYIVVSNAGAASVYKSSDAGAHWSSASTGLPATNNLRIFLFDKSTGALWVGVTVVVSGTVNTTMYESTDGAQSWTKVGNPTTSQMLTLAPTSNPMRFFAGTLAGLVRSDDGGMSWQPIADVPCGDQQASIVRRDPAGNVWALPLSGAFYKSTNHDTFTFAAHGITALQVSTIAHYNFWYIGVDGRGLFRGSGTSWQSSGNGFGLGDGLTNTVVGNFNGSAFALQDEGTIYHSTDGVSWSVVAPPTPGDQFFGLDASGDNVIAVDSGNIVTSTTAGASWTQRTTTLALMAPIVRIDQSSPMVAYIAANGYLSKTTDAGATMVDVQPSASKPVYTALVLDPVTTSTLYAAAQTGQLFKSTNGATSWSTVGSGLPATDYVRAIAIDPTATTTIYAATVSGALYKSKDGGMTFKPVTAPKGLLSIATDSVAGRVLAGTALGVWLTTTGAE